MTKNLLRVACVLAMGLVGTASVPSCAVAQPASSRSAVEVEHHSFTINGVRLHYVVAGAGEPVLLLPGWPQFWYAYRHVIPRLVQAGRQVYVLDPRGLGDSQKPESGYDLDTAASDVHAFIDAAGLARPGGVDVVGHDLGTWIGYAHASAYPADVKRLVMSEATIPGVTPLAGIPTEQVNVKTWHFGFNRLSDLPETLVAGHERAYLTWLFQNKSSRPEAFDTEALDAYTRAFAAPGAARAGFDYYRAMFSEAGLDRMRQRASKKLPMPVLALGGEGGVGEGILRALQPVSENIVGGTIAGCGHYLPDECPGEFVQAILQFWAGK